MSEAVTTLSRGRRKAALGFIFVVALLDVVSLGIMIPVLPNLLKAMVGGDTATAATWQVLFATTWGVAQFLCAPVIGLLSDRFGRRPVILTSIFGLGVDFLFMAFAPTLLWLYVGRIFNGITAASFSAASAYIADVTPPDGRAKAFGLIGAAWGVGFVIGPAIGGGLAEIDLRLPFLVAAGMSLLNWLYGLFILPESLPPERRIKRIDWRRANPLGSVKLLRSHPELSRLASVLALWAVAHNVLPAIFVLYTGHRYGWSPGTIGLTMMLTGVLGIIVQAVLVGPIVKRLGERGTLLLGLCAGAVGMAWFASASEGWAYLAGAPVWALSGLVMPGLQGLMTRRVGSSEQGQLQGATAMINGLAAMGGPALFGLTFAWSLRTDPPAPGAAIYVAAVLIAAAALIAVFAARAQARVTASSSALP